MGIIVDVKDMVAGRVASKIAKMIINGENVTVVNAQDVVVVGTPAGIMEKYERRVNAAVKSNPHYGPKYARIPDRMFRRMVRNMLPTQKSVKERIIKRLMVYNAVPVELAKEKALVFDEYACNHRHHAMTFKEIATHLGGRW